MGEVVVAGSINMDVVALAPRHPVPGETILGRQLQYFPGGVGANQAVAAARAGSTVRLVGAVGDDGFSAELLHFLTKEKVDTAGVSRRAQMSSGTALIVVADDGENSIVMVPGANGTVDEALVGGVVITADDVLVTQYEIPQAAAHAFLKRGKVVEATCVLNPSPAQEISAEVLGLVDFLVLNETELAFLSGAAIGPDSTDEEILVAASRLRGKGMSGSVVVTLGARGALAVTPDGPVWVEGFQVDAKDTTGAGDCFAGVLPAQMAQKADLLPALTFANAAAALSVTEAGAGPSMPTRSEVAAFLAGK